MRMLWVLFKERVLGIYSPTRAILLSYRAAQRDVQHDKREKSDGSK